MGELSHTRRGKNWTNVEDIALCKAYLSVSQDPIIGTNQPSADFWGRIFSTYCDLIENNGVRSQVSCASRWLNIKHPCSKFHGHLTQIQNTYKSGENIPDMYNRAKELYASVEKKPFIVDHCWKILENTIKWVDVSTAGSTPLTQTDTDSNIPSPLNSPILGTTISLDSDHDAEISVSSPRKLPSRRKAEKVRKGKSKLTGIEGNRFCNLMEDFNKQSLSLSLDTGKVQLQERRIKALEDANINNNEKNIIEKEVSETAKRREEREIMMMNLDGMDTNTRLYWEMLKDEVFARQLARNEQSCFKK